MVKVVYSRILGGWYIVRGRHHTPIGGRFDTKDEALASLAMRQQMRDSARAHRP